MAEYIERDKLLYEFREIMPDIGVNELADELYNVALNLPEADVVKVKHGKWIYEERENSQLVWLNCSVCGWKSLDQSVSIAYRYCPICGTKMDLED